jgi:hypothetical protein
LPDGISEYGDRPDIILKGERPIGIEITRLYVESGWTDESEQRQSPLREIVVSDAQKLFLAADERGIELYVTFDTKHPVASRAVQLSLNVEEVQGEGYVRARRGSGRF